MKEMKYVVIGGQYETCYYGGAPTLLGAKRLAGRNVEYWDNWQGFHKPFVYAIEDTEEIECYGWITMRDGETIRVPKYGAEPLYGGKIE